MKTSKNHPPNDSITLPDPFPRSMSPHTLRIPIYASYPYTLTSLPPNCYRRTICQIFAQYYSAAHFLSLFTADRTFKWLDHHTILIIDTDTIVYTRLAGKHNTITLEDVMEYELSPQELLYQLPEQILRQPALLTRPFSSHHNQDITSTVDPDDPQPIPTDSTDSNTRSRRTREPKQKLDRSGLVHVSTIATTLNITPQQARQALRQSKTPKPKGGWWFTPADIPAFTLLIQKHLKKK